MSDSDSGSSVEEYPMFRASYGDPCLMPQHSPRLFPNHPQAPRFSPRPPMIRHHLSADRQMNLPPALMSPQPPMSPQPLLSPQGVSSNMMPFQPVDAGALSPQDIPMSLPRPMQNTPSSRHMNVPRSLSSTSSNPDLSAISPSSGDSPAISSTVSPGGSNSGNGSSKSGKPRDSRYMNTMNALEKAGLLDLTLQTSDLIKRNATLQKDIDMLEEIVKVTRHLMNDA